MSEQDPWAAAQAGMNAQQSAGESQVVPEEEQESQLFSGGAKAPYLANRTHRIGSERTGIITKAPYDKQKVDFNTKKPLFWSDSENKPKPIDDGGNPQRKVMDTFIEVMTEYVMDANEASETGREAPYEGGERVFVAGSHTLKTLRKAIETYNNSGQGKIGRGKDLVGKRLTYRRTGQKPNPGGSPSWVEEIVITNA
jgi:hypothetical protein